jgi:hypothetical protein
MMENKCFLLSLEYYYKTELFDRSVCTGRDKYGVAIPRTSIEKIKIEENAKNLYSKLLAGLKDDGEFKSYFLNMKFERLERIWKTHKEEIKMILINRKIVFSNLSKSKILDENIDIAELTNYVYKNIIKMNERKVYSLTEAEKSFDLMFDYPNIYIDKLIHNFKKYKDKE